MNRFLFTLLSSFLFISVFQVNQGALANELSAFEIDNPFKTYTFTTEGTPQLQVSVVQSDVTIKKHDSKEVRVEMYVRRGMRILSGEPEDIRHLVQQRGDNITVRVQQTRSGTFSSDANVQFIIYAPEETGSQISITGGNLIYDGFSGSNRITVTSGDINMLNTSGQAQVQVTAGKLNVKDFNGLFLGMIRGGSVSMHNINGESRLQITGGSLVLNNIAGSGVAEVVGGNISGGIRDITDAMIFNTVGGNISLEVSDKVAMDLTAKAQEIAIGKGSNWVKGVDDKSEEALYNLRELLTGHIGSGEMVLKVNGGGSPLQMNSLSGSVRVTFK